MKYKLIISDFDDTILNSQLSYSQYFADTVKQFIDGGGHFHIATGRMTPGVIDYARDLGLKGRLITYQGSVVVDVETGEVLENHGFSVENALKITRYIEKIGCYFHIYSDKNVITQQATEFTRIYSNFSKCGVIETVGKVSDYIQEHSHITPKIMAMTNPENVPSLMQELDKEFSDIALVNTSKKWMVEIVPKGVDKGIAAKNLAESLGIKQEETLAIGDSLNDVPMIKWAGLGVIVDNGSDQAKQFADAIAPSNDNEGVASTIRKYGIGF